MKKLKKPQKNNMINKISLFTVYSIDENCSPSGSLYNSCGPKSTGCKK